MSTKSLRSLIRLFLEEKQKDDLLLEPRREGSTAGGSLAGGVNVGMLAEPDVAGGEGPSNGDGGGIDSGDGCDEVPDCKEEEKEDMKREGSGAGAVGGVSVPLGASATYPAPDRRTPSDVRRSTARAVGRAFGGASRVKK